MTVVERKLKPVVAEKFAKNVKSHGGHRPKTVMKKSITLQGKQNRKSQGGQWSPPIFRSSKKCDKPWEKTIMKNSLTLQRQRITAKPSSLNDLV